MEGTRTSWTVTVLSSAILGTGSDFLACYFQSKKICSAEVHARLEMRRSIPCSIITWPRHMSARLTKQDMEPSPLLPTSRPMFKYGAKGYGCVANCTGTRIPTSPNFLNGYNSRVTTATEAYSYYDSHPGVDYNFAFGDKGGKPLYPSLNGCVTSPPGGRRCTRPGNRPHSDNNSLSGQTQRGTQECH